jgi:hypothetical protein
LFENKFSYLRMKIYFSCLIHKNKSVIVAGICHKAAYCAIWIFRKTKSPDFLRQLLNGKRTMKSRNTNDAMHIQPLFIRPIANLLFTDGSLPSIIRRGVARYSNTWI